MQNRRQPKPERRFLWVCAAATLGCSMLNIPIHKSASSNFSFISEFLIAFNLAIPFFVIMPNRIVAFLIATAVFGVMSAINLVKLSEMHFPVVSNDLLLLFSFPLILKFAPPALLAVAALLIGTTVFFSLRFLANLMKSRGKSLDSQTGLLILFFTTLTWIFVLVDQAAPGHGWVAKRLDLKRFTLWDEKATQSNGVLTTFVHGFSSTRLIRPAGMSLETSRAALTDVPLVPEMTLAKKPRTVVVLLVESFFDPAVLDLPLSEDPLKGFRELSRKFSPVNVEVPVFGGYTANTEFEFLTGLSTTALPQNSTPFLDFIHQPLFSYARLFSKAGYETIALHNFRSDSWRRSLVWPFLGFDKTEFSDSFEVDPAKWYPSDASLFKRIVEHIDRGDNPKFIFSVTMGTHGPYDKLAPYMPDRSVRIEPFPGLADYPDHAKRKLENYITRLLVLDQDLQWIANELQKRSVDFVLFGDHLPIAATHFLDRLDLRRSLGDLKDQIPYTASAAEYFTPGLVSIEGLSPTAIPKNISVHCLGSLLVNAHGIAGSPLTRYLEHSCRESQYLRYAGYRKEINPRLNLERNIVIDVLENRLGLEEHQKLVDRMGIEPTAFALRTRRSPS